MRSASTGETVDQRAHELLERFERVVEGAEEKAGIINVPLDDVGEMIRSAVERETRAITGRVD